MKIENSHHIIDSSSQDWLGRSIKKAVGVCFPTTDKDVIECIKKAKKENLSLKIKGGNTSLSGQTLILNDKTLVIDTSKLKSVLSLNDDLLKLSSGFTLDEANNYLRDFNRSIPLHMGSFQSATLGGIASTNAGGMHAWKYGMARNFIRSLKVVLSDGSIVDESTTSLKNNTLFGVTDAVIGAEGKFGVITELTLQTYQKQTVSEGILISCDCWDEMQSIFQSIEKSHLNYIEVCEYFINPTFLNINKDLKKFNIVIGMLGNFNTEIFLNDFDKNSNNKVCFDNIFLLNHREFSEILELRENLPIIHKDFSDLYKLDLMIPRISMYKLYKLVSDKLKIAHFTFFGHFLDNNVHLNISKNCLKENDVDMIITFVQNNGGSYSAEHGVGRYKNDIYKNTKALQSQKLFKSMKLALDEKDLFY